MNTIIKKVSIRNRHFTIVKDEAGYYLAIEDKYITDGKLNQTLNGFQMHAHKELQGCLNSVKDCVEVAYLVSQGMSKAEAFCTYWGMMDQLTEIEKIMSA